MSLHRALCFAVALAVSGIVAADGLAQERRPTVVGVVAVQAIMRDALAAQSIQDQIELRRGRYQAEISDEERRLREVEQELTRQRSVLAPEAFAKRRSEFQVRVAEVQRAVQERRRGLEQAYAQGARRLQRELTAIIREIAEERSIDVVVPVSQTLFAAAPLSISDEVLKRLDERMPEITLQFPEN